MPPAGGPEPVCGIWHYQMGITELTIAVWPWLLTMLGFLVLITYVPAISLWLPGTLGMM